MIDAKLAREKIEDLRKAIEYRKVDFSKKIKVI